MCVHACARACVHACMLKETMYHICVCVYMSMCVHVYVCVCVSGEEVSLLFVVEAANNRLLHPCDNDNDNAE